MTLAKAALSASLVLLCAAPALARSTPRLYVQETDNVKVLYYDPAHEFIVRHLIACTETAIAFDRVKFHYTPSEKVTVLVEDFTDFGHGGAVTIPRNFVNIGLEPLSYTFETLPTNERVRSVMNHEMIHVTMADNAAGSDLVFRRVFRGKVFPNQEDPLSMLYSNLASPRHYAPRWYHEGIAAFLETWLNGGVGRGLGGYDEMTFRSMARDEAYFYKMVGLEAEGTTIDFQVGANAYLYGTRFLTYLVHTYGPERFTDWISRTPDSKIRFTSQFEKVYGIPITREWDKWIAAELDWQKANLKRIQEFPLTKFDRVPTRTLGSVSRSYYDPERNVVYAAIRYLGAMAHIAAIHLDTGEVERLEDVKGSSLYYVTSLSFDAKNRRIFYASDNTNWRDLNVLDLETRKSRRLIRDGRTGDLVYSPSEDALWGIRHHNGISTIVRIPAPFNKVEPLYSFEYGYDLFDLDLSPDGQSLTGGMTDLSGRQKLVRFSTAKLKAKDGAFDVLHDFDYNTPGNFVFSPDGRYLYGSSYYTGVSNLWRYDFQEKKTDILTNVETGMFRPLPLPDGRLLAYEHNSKGFTLGFVDAKPLENVNAIQYLGQAAFEKHQSLRSWKLPSPAEIPVDSLIKKAGFYHPVKETRLFSLYPIVQGYKDSAAGGVRVDFGDRLQVFGFHLTASYSPDRSLPTNERFHAGLDGHFWGLKFSGYYNNADFYDLFGPTKNSRKGYAGKIENTHHLLYDTPRTVDLVWSVAGYGGMDRLPDAQNVAVGYKRFAIAKIGLNSSAKEKSLGAVDDEKGESWTLNARATYTGPKTFPRFYGTYDRGILTPLRNSSVWFHAAGGKAFGNSNDPFGNFYFGGFGNNWVDHQEISRYREYYSFAGVDLNAIGANNFGKGVVEWNLPPVRFKRLGATTVYCNWARLSLFSSGLFTNLSNAATRGVYGNLGAQVDFRIVLFTWLNSTFSTGYAVATDKNGRRSTEYMVSLKLL